MSVQATSTTNNANSPTEADQNTATTSEKSNSPSPSPQLPSSPTATAEKGNQSSDDDMSSKRKTSILESLEKRTELRRAENRRVQEKLYNSAEAEMLLRNEDAIVKKAIEAPHTSTSKEYARRQLQDGKPISIGAELHMIRELRDERGSFGGERRGGSSRAGPSKKRTTKKH